MEGANCEFAAFHSKKGCSTSDSTFLPLISLQRGGGFPFTLGSSRGNADSTLSLLLNDFQIPEIKQNSVLKTIHNSGDGRPWISHCVRILATIPKRTGSAFFFFFFSTCQVSHVTFPVSHVACHLHYGQNRFQPLRFGTNAFLMDSFI